MDELKKLQFQSRTKSYIVRVGIEVVVWIEVTVGAEVELVAEVVVEVRVRVGGRIEVRVEKTCRASYKRNWKFYFCKKLLLGNVFLDGDCIRNSLRSCVTKK